MDLDPYLQGFNLLVGGFPDEGVGLDIYSCISAKFIDVLDEWNFIDFTYSKKSH